MGIFKKPLLRGQQKRDDMPEGLWAKCPECGALIHSLELKQNLQVCPHCGHHFLLDSTDRIFLLADPGTFEETEVGLFSANPLGFSGYEEKIQALREKTRMNDAVITGRITIHAKPAMIAVMDFKFFAGSMGSVVGEKITRAIETAIAEKRGVIIVSASSGARMQEGMLSLMQMAKTCGALARLGEAVGAFLRRHAQDVRHVSDGADRDARGPDRAAAGVGNNVHGFHDGVVVVERLAHAHEDEVAEAAVRMARGERAADVLHLRDDFPGGEVAHETHLPRGTEHATHRAARL